MTAVETRVARTRVLEYRSSLDRRSPETAASSQGGRAPDPASDPPATALREGLDIERQLALERGEADVQPEVDRLMREMQLLRANHEAAKKAVAEQERAAGYAAAKREDQVALQARCERLDQLIRTIDAAARSYTHVVEREVVALTLDIASRVLKHEAQIDSLLLRGAVRATLEALCDGGEVHVVVPEKDVAEWQVELKTPMLEKKRIVVAGDPTMHAGECICRLTTGTLNLGIRSQMGEIERSFASILQKRGTMNDAMSHGMSDAMGDAWNDTTGGARNNTDARNDAVPQTHGPAQAPATDSISSGAPNDRRRPEPHA